jgi:hypothetical protein
MTVHLVSKELEGIHTELTLRWVDDHPIFVEAGKQQAKMLCMEVSIGTGDEKVVNVRITKVKSGGSFRVGAVMKGRRGTPTRVLRVPGGGHQTCDSRVPLGSPLRTGVVMVLDGREPESRDVEQCPSYSD